MDSTLITYHTPKDGTIELHREQRHYMPKGYEYIVVFQQTLEHVLTYELNKTELKTFNFVMSQVGFENNLVMPALAELCAKKTGAYRQNVSKALKRLSELNIIVREPIEHTKTFRYRINYALCAKDKGSEIAKKFIKDREENPIIANQTSLF